VLGYHDAFIRHYITVLNVVFEIDLCSAPAPTMPPSSIKGPLSPTASTHRERLFAQSMYMARDAPVAECHALLPQNNHQVHSLMLTFR
jgi:hypothetical protein